MILLSILPHLNTFSLVYTVFLSKSSYEDWYFKAGSVYLSFMLIFQNWDRKYLTFVELFFLKVSLLTFVRGLDPLKVTYMHPIFVLALYVLF